jgi:hypothetical protein
MENEKRDKSQPIAEVGGDANNGNRQALYQRNFGRLLACVESQQLFFEDAERLVVGLATQLDAFPGDTDQEFIEWVSAILKPAIQRLRRFYELREKYSTVVHSAIWRTLGHTTEPNKLDDYPELVRELANEIWLYIFLNLGKLTDPGTAKLSTRLFGLARQHTRNWKKKQQGRLAAVSRRVATGKGLGVETLSELEIAEMKATERQVAA